MPYKLNALLQRDHKACHTLIRNWQLTAFGSFYKRATDLKVDTTRIVEQPAAPQPKSNPQEPKAETQQPKSQTPQPAQTSQASQTPKTQETPQPAQTLYAVQIFASHERIAADDPRFLGRTDCDYIKIGEWYKYYCGATTNSEEAFKLQQQLKNKFPGCFVIKVNK